LPAPERKAILDGLTEPQLQSLLYDWKFLARPKQLLPKGDWRYWLVLAGRGFGKTRTGAETVRQWVANGYRIIHLVASTAGDARDVMVQGESGLLNCFPPEQRPNYEPSKRLITFHNGAVARLFSADEPERLRGPQCEAFWADELAAWRFLQEAWDNLQFGFRLGNDPRGIITTTPKPLPLLKDLIADRHTAVTRASSYENRANLAPAFFDSIIKKYEGTRLGRQELMAELLEDVPGALWTMARIDAARIRSQDVVQEALLRVVVAIDPAVSSNEQSAETGIIVAALTRTMHVIVLVDLTIKASPLEWAKVVVDAYVRHKCDRVVAEVNNGGDLVESNLRGVAPNLPYRSVRASRGKTIRAEPAAALYEQGRVHHVGNFPMLEEQMCSWSPASGQRSPDRMDALVWALYDLVIDPEEQTQAVQIMPRVVISRY
jgi:phage terminase large subunit-like protein